MRDFLAIAKALADGTRLRALMALRDGELCLCQLVDLLELAPSTVSKHLNMLYAAGLLERRKESRWVYYRLASRGASPTVRQLLKLVTQSLANEATIMDDASALRCVLEKDAAELCQVYTRS